MLISVRLRQIIWSRNVKLFTINYFLDNNIYSVTMSQAWNITPQPFYDAVTEVANSTQSVLVQNQTKTTTFNLGSKTGSLYIVIPITIIYVIIFFTGLIGNISTCIVISRNKSMHTTTNYYLFSLAVSDLLLLITGLPPEMYSIWSRYPYVFGEVFCVLRGLIAETCTNATVLTITAFTVERYIAICHPFLSHTMSKLSRAVKLIILIWIVALCFAIPQALQLGIVDDPQVICIEKRIIFEHSFELSTFLFFVTPMTLITILYILIGLKLRSSSIANRNNPRVKSTDSRRSTNTEENSSSYRHQHSQSSRKVLKMLVAVVLAFFICWAPFHVQRLVAIYRRGDQSPFALDLYEIVTYISGILYYVSATINPVLYHIMSNKFREAFKDTFAKCFGCCGKKLPTYSVLSRSSGNGTTRRFTIQRGESTDSGTSLTNRLRKETLSTSLTDLTNVSNHKQLASNHKKKEAVIVPRKMSKTSVPSSNNGNFPETSDL